MPGKRGLWKSRGCLGRGGTSDDLKAVFFDRDLFFGRAGRKRRVMGWGLSGEERERLETTS